MNDVSWTEVCDSCGDGRCGNGLNSFGEQENCDNCPADCGACPPPVCGNGVCEPGESWASPADGSPYTRPMGPLTCPADCGYLSVCIS